MSIWSAGKTFAVLVPSCHLFTHNSCSSFFFLLGTGTAHEPPSTLVMKEQRWFVASEMVTQLLSSGGEVGPDCSPLVLISHRKHCGFSPSS